VKVKAELLRQVLDDYVMTAKEFAREMEVDVSEVEKMLSGETVGADTARKFICYIGPIEAERIIDWAAMCRKSPYACEADGECGDGGGSNDGN